MPYGGANPHYRWMRLHLRREQTKQSSVFGTAKGSEFALAYQLELSDAEQRLVTTFGLGDYVLTEYDDPRGRTVRVTVNDAQRGQRYTETNFPDIARSEAAMRSSCAAFAQLISAARGFRGKETIDL